MLKFRNRIEAGKLLATKIKDKKYNNPIILSIPRGGVETAFPIAQKLDIKLSLVLAKKISHPNQKELAIGAINIDKGLFLSKEYSNLEKRYLKEETKLMHKLLLSKQKEFMQYIPKTHIKNKTAIIVDDGIATGMSVEAAIALVKSRKPKKIIIATPVISEIAYNMLIKKCNEIISLVNTNQFSAISQFYKDFPQLTDKKVIEYLEARNFKN